MIAGMRLLSARTVGWLDIAVLVWIAVWIALGVLVWHDIRMQAALSENVIKMGVAVEDTGEALALVGRLPLVGGGISEFADRITSTGAEVEASGRESRDSIMRVALVSGIGVGVLPVAMVLLLYLPLRLSWRRDVAAIAAALARPGGDPGLDLYLARRAIDALPWNRLHALSGDPWRSIADGHVRALADAELERLGLDRPR